MVETEMYASEPIADFLSYLDDVQTSYNMAQSTLEEANLELSDLEHYLELETCNGAAMTKIAKRIREIRAKRRRAKNDIETCIVIIDWIEKHKTAINELRLTLGAVRKVENKQENRVYSIRSHILDDITDKTHLSRFKIITE